MSLVLERKLFKILRINFLLGYGILGHAKLLAQRQRNAVNFVIHNLPVIHKMQNIAKACGNTFGLMQGNAPEISGGLLIALPREQVIS